MNGKNNPWVTWSKENPFKVFGWSLLAVFVALLFLSYVEYGRYAYSLFLESHRGIERLAQFGDSFGFFSSVFTSVSTLLVGFALLYQIRELSLLKTEIRQQSENTKKLIAEAEEANRYELATAYDKDEPLLKYADRTGWGKDGGQFNASIYFRNHGADVHDIQISEDGNNGVIEISETRIPNCGNLEKKGFQCTISGRREILPVFRLYVAYTTQTGKSRAQIYAISNNLASWHRVQQHPGPSDENY